MKVAVVGGGSTYSPELLFGLAQRARALGIEEIALMDTDASRLEVVGGFVERMCRHVAPELVVERHSELAPAVSGARFVVVQIRVGGQAARLADERLGVAFGMVGQETTGVGGFAKALRTIPALLDVARAVEAHAPEAILVNFTNPVSIVTEALLGHAKVPVIGLCNIPISQRLELAAQLGVPATDVELDSVGLNHLSFVRRVLVRGKDVLPELITEVTRLLSSGHRPANLPDLDFPAELISSLGMIPSDYLRYFYLQRETIEEQARRAGRLRAEEVMIIERELLEYYGDPAHSDRPPSLSKRGGAHYSHAALEIIEAVVHDRGARLVVDVKNGGCLPELPASACIEVPCEVGSMGAKPIAQPPLEPAIRGLIQHVKAYEELTVHAALSKTRRDAYLALIAHPLMPSAATASKIIDVLVQRLGW